MGWTFDSEFEGGSCRIDTHFVLGVVGMVFLGVLGTFTAIVTYRRRARIFHWIRFCRTRAQIPELLSDEYLRSFKLQRDDWDSDDEEEEMIIFFKNRAKERNGPRARFVEQHMYLDGEEKARMKVAERKNADVEAREAGK